MALKVVEAHVPPDLAQEVEQTLEPLSRYCWVEEGGRFGSIVSSVMGSQQTGSALDRLHDQFEDRAGLMVLVRPLDAALPRPLAAPEEARTAARTAAAVSREEVYAAIADNADLDPTYTVFVITASIVAAIGLALDNTAAVIGAMVVAPLLGPTMALALGFVLGDLPLVRRALFTSVIGLGLAFAVAVVLGYALDADPTIPELASRAQVSVWDLLLALAAGCAGALSYTTGVPTYLTGVMVAVALLPPAVASGVLLAAGHAAGAGAALLLAGSNVTAITLAAMLTFLWRGMRPRNWWQEDRARRSARLGIAIFVSLFALLAGLILLAERLLAGQGV